MQEQPLCASLLLKIQEQIDRTVHLINLVPVERANWQPDPAAWPLALLLGHLLDCTAGFCAVLTAAEPQRLAHFARLRDLPVNAPCAPADAVTRLELYRTHIERGFALLTDRSLARTIPTVFSGAGETLLTLFLGNLEHLINHKHQLFTYLKLMGVPVATPDLYRFRPE